MREDIVFTLLTLFVLYSGKGLLSPVWILEGGWEAVFTAERADGSW